MAVQIKLETAVEISGPLFDGRSHPIMRDFFRDATRMLGDAGVERIRERLAKRAKQHTGSFGGAVKVHRLAKGQVIMADYPQVLYGPWLEGTSERNRSTRFKGYRIFRLTRSWLRKNVGPLIHDRFQQALRELGGGGAP